jgi:hypothetical protein
LRTLGELQSRSSLAVIHATTLVNDDVAVTGQDVQHNPRGRPIRAEARTNMAGHWRAADAMEEAVKAARRKPSRRKPKRPAEGGESAA